jgi:hypothetical protein
MEAISTGETEGSLAGAERLPQDDWRAGYQIQPDSIGDYAPDLRQIEGTPEHPRVPTVTLIQSIGAIIAALVPKV